jgi:flavin reductase (DIM6/NTAB) family NADH-FMN oxidoreductase RutF
MDHPCRPLDRPGAFPTRNGQFRKRRTLIAAKWPDGVIRAMTASAFMSGSLEPPLCVVSVSKRAHMHACLIQADAFSVNVLEIGQEALSNHFAGKPVSGLRVQFDEIDGVPVLPKALAHIVNRKAAVHDCGDHSLFIGAITMMESRDGEPLLYHAGQYGSLRDLPRDTAEEIPRIW